jgi:hypothetical protein
VVRNAMYAELNAAITNALSAFLESVFANISARHFPPS